ncbi:hypothetical protein P691DRAFT_805144 [Macrolepiota fuliginosa MF-IS2]|uniref:Uncharacterized protein n=1 Tax=Macrolepiota fuliginosa MF-IS2 TaxID=1400762 RepID=A0A9P6C5B2_9AGAR|nr:hypothetical protein P691DRAFT_805144 [Macrolepiota fuliginosa MF-IS2]
MPENHSAEYGGGNWEMGKPVLSGEGVVIVVMVGVDVRSAWRERAAIQRMTIQ